MSRFSESLNVVEEKYQRLTSDQKAELMPIIKEIQRVQGVVTDRLHELELDKICAQCEGACCGSGLEAIILPEEYLLFLMISLEGYPREKQEEVLSLLKATNASPQCRFENKGCVIPTDIMPPACKAHFCDVNREAGIIRSQSQRVFDIRFRDFHSALLNLGVRLRSEFDPY